MASGTGKPIKKFDFTAGVVDLRAALEAYGLGERRDLTICFPACVREYDREKHRVQVIPLVKQGVFSGEWEYIDREPYWVNVRGIQQGGFAIDVPLYVGDTGWVIASDRDTRLLREEEALTTTVLSKDRPLEMVDKGYRKRPWQAKLHDLESGFFLPDNWGRFDIGRYKDSQTVGIRDGLYIGSSMSSKDERGNTGDEGGESLPEEGFQEGDEYEKSTTASIVIEKDGGVHMLSSPPKEEQKTSRISVYGNKISSELISEKEEKVIYSEIGLGNGFIKRIYDGGRNFIFQETGNQISFQDVSESKDGGGDDEKRNKGKNVLSIFLNNGKVTVAATGDLDIKGEDNITVFSEGDIDVIADSVDVLSAEKASVSSISTLLVNSAGDIEIESSGDLSISAYSLSLGSIEDIEIESGGTLNIICEAKSVYLDSDGTIEINPSKLKWRGHRLTHRSGYYAEPIGRIYTTKTVDTFDDVGLHSGYSGFDMKNYYPVNGKLEISGGIKTEVNEFTMFASEDLKMKGFNKSFVTDVWGYLYAAWGT